MAVYVSAVAVSLVAVVLGAAVCRLLRVPGWLAPTLGLSAALLLVLVGMRLPGRVWAAVAVLALGLVVSVAVVVRGGLDGRGLRDAVSLGLPVAVVLLLAGSLPFIAYGRIGDLGPGFTIDPFFHLGQADAMRESGAEARVMRAGYPSAPHALIATVGAALGVATEAAFLGLLLAIPVLAGLTALAGLDDLPPARRLVAAPLVGLPYLPASYFVQASFKELILASCVLTVALVARSARGRSAWARGHLVAIALVSAGGVAAFGWPAVAWPLATLGVLAVLAGGRDAARRLVARAATRRKLAAGAAGAAAGAALLVVAAQASGFLDGAGRYLFTEGAGGNFVGQLSPFEAVGTWPASDFRLPPPAGGPLFWAVVAFGSCVVAWGVVRSWRRREFALLAAALAAAGIYAAGRPFTLAYNSGKALAVLAPLLTLIALRTALRDRPLPGTGRGRRLLAIAVAAGFAAATAGSSAWALRAAVPRPQEVADDAAALRPVLAGEPTLYLGRSDWIGWDLRGTFLSAFHNAPTPLGFRLREGQNKTPDSDETDVVDVDSLPPTALDSFRYVLAPRTTYLSAMPPNFRRVRRSRWHVLWERVGPTPARRTLPESGAPGAVLSCPARGRRPRGVAWVRPRPVTGAPDRWRAPEGSAGAGGGAALGPDYLQPGGSLAQTLELGPGRWELALSYFSPVPLRLLAGGRETRLPAYVEDSSRLFAAAPVVVRAERTPVRVEISTSARPLAVRAARLGLLVATRTDDRGRLVPLARACGAYVDWWRGRPPEPSPAGPDGSRPSTSSPPAPAAPAETQNAAG